MNLNEATLLNNVRLRYGRDAIYVSDGTGDGSGPGTWVGTWVGSDRVRDGDLGRGSDRTGSVGCRVQVDQGSSHR